MERGFFYGIMDFSPRQEMGELGFGIELSRDYARKAIRTKLTKRGYKNFNMIGTDIVNVCGLADTIPIITPYHFLYDTLMLQFCQVPGNACDLSIDPAEGGYLKEGSSDHQRPVVYSPHNVDSPAQALALLALWTNWANTLLALVNK